MTKPGTDEVGHRQAVMAANKIYMTAEQHVIIFSRALYPVFDAHYQVCRNAWQGAKIVHMRQHRQCRFEPSPPETFAI